MAAARLEKIQTRGAAIGRVCCWDNFLTNFLNFWGLVLAHFRPSQAFRSSKIGSGWPDGSRHTKRELGSSSETYFRAFLEEVGFGDVFFERPSAWTPPAGKSKIMRA